MIRVIFDKSKLASSVKEKVIEVIGPTSTIYRQIALDLIPIIQERIHVQGKAADGNEIGNYSLQYIKIRQRNKRNSDPKVILSLTRQMENDYAVVATQRGWGIGFNNQFNLNKAKWNNKRYGGRTIYDLTASELETVTKILNALIEQQFK